LEVFVKKNKRSTPELEEGFAAGLAAGLATNVTAAQMWAQPRMTAAQTWAQPRMTAAQTWAQPHVETAYGWAKPRWEKGLETAGPALQDTVRKASEGISGGIAVVTPKIQDSLDKVGARITEVIDETAPKIQGTMDKATPALNSAKLKVVDDYLPALSNKLGEAADTASRSLASATVHPAVEKAVVKVTGDKKAVKNAQKRLVAATAQASKDLTKSKKRSSGKGWLVFGIISAAIVAVVAAWRASKPVEDPWKTPAPLKTATPAPVSSQKSQEAKEVVAAIKEAADRASNNTPDTGADVKNTVAESAKDITEDAKDASETAKHAAKPGDDAKA
jgi:gas vesicle protein